MIDLNYSCFKDVLLYIKNKIEIPTYVDNPNPISFIDICNDSKLSSSYPKTQIRYTLKKLEEIEFISCHGCAKRSKTSSGGEFVDDITMKGYDFIINSMNERIWKKTINTSNTVGMISFNSFCKLMDRIAVKLSIDCIKKTS